MAVERRYESDPKAVSQLDGSCISQSERSIRESLFAVNFQRAPCARESLKMRFIIPLQGLSEVHGRTLGIDLARIRDWTRRVTRSHQVSYEFRGNRLLGIHGCLGDMSSTCIPT